MFSVSDYIAICSVVTDYSMEFVSLYGCMYCIFDVPKKRGFCLEFLEEMNIDRMLLYKQGSLLDGE